MPISRAKVWPLPWNECQPYHTTVVLQDSVVGKRHLLGSRQREMMLAMEEQGEGWSLFQPVTRCQEQGCQELAFSRPSLTKLASKFIKWLAVFSSLGLFSVWPFFQKVYLLKSKIWPFKRSLAFLSYKLLATLVKKAGCSAFAYSLSMLLAILPIYNLSWFTDRYR